MERENTIYGDYDRKLYCSDPNNITLGQSTSSSSKEKILEKWIISHI